MSTRLVILGLLRERPLHGYEIKHIIEDHMGDWTSIAFGSIYFALRKLADQGLLKIEATEQQGGRPSRTVYGVTDAGRTEFLRLLRALWGGVKRETYTIDLGLFFMDALPESEIVSFLQQRVEELEKSLAYLQVHRNDQLANPHVPARARWIFDHSTSHLQAELAWTQTVLSEVQTKDTKA